MTQIQRFLVWDTSAKTGIIGAFTAIEANGVSELRIACELTLNIENTQHSENLLWGIDQVLQACRWEAASVDFLGVGIGPGSFTGLRIGITTARTFAQQLGKPLIPVSSLRIAIEPYRDLVQALQPNAELFAVRDACKGQVFFLRYSLFRQAIEMEAALTPEAALAVVTETAQKNKPWLLVGSGFHLYPDLAQQLPSAGRITLSPAFGLSEEPAPARAMGLLAWEAFRARAYPSDPLEVQPNYLRESEAERKLQQGLLKKQPVNPVPK